MQSKYSSLNWQLSKGLSVFFSEQYPTAHMSTLRRHPYSLYRLCIVNVVVQVQLLLLLHLFHFLTLKTLWLIIIEGKSKGVRESRLEMKAVDKEWGLPFRQD